MRISLSDLYSSNDPIPVRAIIHDGANRSKRTTNQSYATALTGLSRYISIFMSLSLAVKHVRFTPRRLSCRRSMGLKAVSYLESIDRLTASSPKTTFF